MPASALYIAAVLGTGILVLPGLAADGRYRTNVAVYLSSPDGWAAAQASVAVRDGEGTLLRTIPVSLDQESRPTRQLSSAELFGDLPGDRSRFTVSVEGVTGSSPVSAYATCIDQISGDATFQSGQLAGDLR